MSRSHSFPEVMDADLVEVYAVFAAGSSPLAAPNNRRSLVQNPLKNTETVGLTYWVKNWDLGYFHNRIGPMCKDNGGANQVIAIVLQAGIFAFETAGDFTRWSRRKD
jgi:hypothetical protein